MLRRMSLVGSFLIQKAAFKLLLPHRILWEGEPVGDLSGAIKLHQLLGHFSHGRPHFAGGALPIGASHAAQLRSLPARVGAQSIQLLHRHEELVVASVFQQQIVAQHALKLTGVDACVFGDPVMTMHHIAVGRERDGISQGVCGFARNGWRSSF